VVIDDGSTDNTSHLVEEFANSILGLSLVHRKTANLGSANARNIGLNLAQGKWIMFLDSDDTLDPYTVTSFLNKSEDHLNIDLIRFSYATCQQSIHRESIENNLSSLMSQKGFWRYIYSRNFIVQHQITFFPTFEDAGGFYVLDDWYFLLWVLSNTPRVELSNDVIYHYNTNQRTPKEEEARYLKQVELEFNAFNRVKNQGILAKTENVDFFLETLYSRMRMICLLLNPSPTKLAKLKLCFSFARILMLNPTNKVGSYLVRTSGTVLRLFLS
jgi:glycosyltransferase involved in cell wall biosynthesis